MKKHFWGPNLGQRVEIGPETSFFPHFLKFGVLVFLEIACNDSLQQCITYSKDKTHEKKF